MESNFSIIHRNTERSLYEIVSNDTLISEFHSMISRWLKEIHEDISQSGYIIHDPKTPYGKKVKEIVNYSMSKSPEISLIHLHRAKNRTVYRDGIRCMYFVLEAFLPFIAILFVCMGGYLVYNGMNEKREYVGDIWSLETFVEYSGKGLGRLFRIPFSLTYSALDESIGVGGKISSIYFYIIIVFVSVLTYIVCQPIIRIIQYYRELNEKNRDLFYIQEAFIDEYRNAIERSILNITFSTFLSVLERFLTISSKTSSVKNRLKLAHIIATFSHDYSVFYLVLLKSVEVSMKNMNLNDILRASGLPRNFIHRLVNLMRVSSDEISNQICLLNQTLLTTPNDIQNRLTQIVKRSIYSITDVTSNVLQKL